MRLARISESVKKLKPGPRNELGFICLFCDLLGIFRIEILLRRFPTGVAQAEVKAEFVGLDVEDRQTS